MRNGAGPKYEIVIYWDESDDIFIAEAPDLPGCVAHGQTQSAALAQINDAIGLWLDTARKYGDPIPEPRSHKLAA